MKVEAARPRAPVASGVDWPAVPVRATVVVALAVLAVLAFRTVWTELFYRAAFSSELSHIFAVPPATALLLWVRRRRWGQGRVRGLWVGPALVLLGVAMYVSSEHLSADTLWFGGAVTALVGAAVSVWGVEALLRFAPAWLCMYFVIPVPAVAHRLVANHLQHVSTALAADLIKLLGVAVDRSGWLLTVNGYPLNVAEACSGIRSLFALSITIFVFAFARGFRWPVRLILLLCFPLIAVICNVVRLAVTAWTYGSWGATAGAVVHDTFGWLTFALACLLCMQVEAVLAWAGLRTATPADAATPAKDPAAAVGPRRGGGPAVWAAGLVTAATLLGMAKVADRATAYESTAGYHEEVRRAVLGLPLEFDEWTATLGPLSTPAMELLKPNAYYNARFTQTTTGRSFAVSLIQCRFARDMAAHTPPVCFPASGWARGLDEEVAFDVGGVTVPTTEYTFRRVTHDRLAQVRVVNFYLMPDGRLLRREGDLHDRAKLAWIDAYGAAQVQFVFDASFAQAERRELVQRFLEQNWPAFASVLKGQTP